MNSKVTHRTNVDRESTLALYGIFAGSTEDRPDYEIEVRDWHGQLSMHIRAGNGFCSVPLPGDAAAQLARLLTQTGSEGT